LRWLTGKRSENENWDAFEAPGGQLFRALAKEPLQWKNVRFWLWDLAQELSTAQRDNTLPQVLTVDRVWITDEGKPKILDVPAPGAHCGKDSSDRPAESLLPEQFLARFAVAALKGDPDSESESIPVPIPQHAREFVSGLKATRDLDELILKLAPLLRRTAVVTHLKRGAMVFGCLAFPLFVLGSSLFGRMVLEEFEKQQPEILELNQIMAVRSGARFASHEQRPTDENFSVVISSKYGQFVANDARWNSPLAKIMIAGERRKFVERSVSDYPNPTPEQIAAAHKKVPAIRMGDLDKEFGRANFLMIVFFSTFIIYVCIPAIIAALCFRGGLVLLASRIVFVRRNGMRASRLRMFWRSLISWAPLGLCMVATSSSIATHKTWIGVVGMIIVGVLAAISVILPERGLQDRLAGTWPVPK
jgi:hypothetical protein